MASVVRAVPPVAAVRAVAGCQVAVEELVEALVAAPAVLVAATMEKATGS